MPKNEEWRPFPRYKNILVSSLGNVRHTSGRPVKMNIKKGYLRISSGSIVVHRMVAITFIPNPLNLPAVNHKDNIKTNNSVENLEWITIGDNIKHAAALGVYKGENHNRAKITSLEAVEIFQKLKKPETSYYELMSYYGMSYASIAHMAKGNSWHLEREIAGYIPFKRRTGPKTQNSLKDLSGHA